MDDYGMPGRDDLEALMRALTGGGPAPDPATVRQSRIETLQEAGFSNPGALVDFAAAGNPEGYGPNPELLGDPVEVCVTVSTGTLASLHNAIGFTLGDGLDKSLQAVDFARRTGAPVDAVLDTDHAAAVEPLMLDALRFLADLKAAHAIARTPVPDDISSLLD
jgi:hypothetical protein